MPDPFDSETFDTLSSDTRDELLRQMHRMSLGVDALEALSLMIPNAIDQEIGLTGEQAGSLLTCVEFSLLTTQRKIVALLHN